MSQIKVFWSNREIKMPPNSKIAQKTAEWKCHENFMPQKCLALEVPIKDNWQCFQKL